MGTQILHQEVEAFRKAEALDYALPDCFPAWYLKRTFGMTASQAIMCSSDPGIVGKTKGDSGLDAFYLEPMPEGQAKLILIQAKFSASIPLISKGFRELGKSLRPVKAVLDGIGSPDVQNKVYVNLRAAAQKQFQGEPGKAVLDFECRVIHLNDQDPQLIRLNCRSAIEELKDEFQTLFPEGRCEVKLIGPTEMGGDGEHVYPSKVDWFPLHFSGVPLTVSLGDRQVTMYSGQGRLAEVVELYNLRRDHLFEKNVRYFLKSKKNTEGGPSGKMRETLKEMCISPVDKAPDPALFAFYHNGITIFVRDVRLGDGGGVTEVREPFVLNGCQTIKTGFYFVGDSRLNAKIDQKRWNRVQVPLRIITTKDEELIRKITVNNNRQNQISASALRANDPIQIELAERFGKRGVFYQRQKGAFDEKEEVNPQLILDEFSNTNGACADIEDLARCLAATAGEIEFAKSPSSIFESDTEYDKCFGLKRKRVASVTLLTFLQNLENVLLLVLKRELKPDPPGPSIPQLKYYAMCLLMRYLAKTRQERFLIEYGGALVGRKRNMNQQFHNSLAKYLGKDSGITKELQVKFIYALAGLDARSEETLRSVFRRTEAVLNLRDNIDPFAVFQSLDETGSGS